MGVRFLLDTHVFLWLLTDPDRVPGEELTALADPANELLVSAVSALEVATKERIGKLTAPGLVDGWTNHVAAIGAQPLTITTEHALLAGRLPWVHRDPFDRLLVAQATIDGLVLVTVDSAMTQLPAPRILSW
ncbi:MAG: type II toxin-antitoxin system VapC family toxin [Propionibacteriaceae bacterium]|nr:type II toxin-antitoxin system VapC family toxin [Propionibacteriaceae bacterium]